MDSFDFKNLEPTNFPDGAYLVVLSGAAPVDGVVLSRMKVVVGWPNPILTTLVRIPIISNLRTYISHTNTYTHA